MSGIDSQYVYWQPEPYSGCYDVYLTYADRDANRRLCQVERHDRNCWLAYADGVEVEASSREQAVRDLAAVLEVRS